MTRWTIAVLTLGLAACLTAGCTSPGAGTEAAGGDIQTPAPEEAGPPSSSVAPAAGPPPEIARTMIIADMLYAARVAYEDNRLTRPAGDNAYDRYREVLRFDPGNQMARQGIADIVTRYVQLADSAMRIGQYDKAGGYLDKAGDIEPENEVVARGRRRLAEARKTRVEYFTLDPEGLEEQSLNVMVELGEIARLIRREEATFLITSRSDAEGRWIYKVMREAVGGYRLRGNIAVGEEPGVQVQIPSS